MRVFISGNSRTRWVRHETRWDSVTCGSRRRCQSWLRTELNWSGQTHVLELPFWHGSRAAHQSAMDLSSGWAIALVSGSQHMFWSHKPLFRTLKYITDCNLLDCLDLAHMTHDCRLMWIEHWMPFATLPRGMSGWMTWLFIKTSPLHTLAGSWTTCQLYFQRLGINIEGQTCHEQRNAGRS